MVRVNAFKGLVEVVDSLIGEAIEIDYNRSCLRMLNTEQFIEALQDNLTESQLQSYIKFDYTYSQDRSEESLEITLSFEGKYERLYTIDNILENGIENSEGTITDNDFKQISSQLIPLINEYFGNISMLSFRVDFGMSKITLPYRYYLINEGESYIKASIMELMSIENNLEKDNIRDKLSEIKVIKL